MKNVKKTKIETKSVTLNIPVDLLEKIEYVMSKRTLIPPRHTWILEGVIEKLTRELKEIESGKQL